MRPTTARRRPPKVKETTQAVTMQEAITQNKAAKKAVIMKEGDGDDDDFFKDDEVEDEDGLGGEAKFISKDDLKGKNVSNLVANIVAEQEEEKRQGGEEKVDDGKKGIRLGLNLKKSAAASSGGGMSQTDMENLTKAVQRLVVSTAPLGRCMDYVQEDLAQMQKEHGKWSASYRSNIDAFTEAQKRTQQVREREVATRRAKRIAKEESFTMLSPRPVNIGTMSAPSSHHLPTPCHRF